MVAVGAGFSSPRTCRSNRWISSSEYLDQGRLRQSDADRKVGIHITSVPLVKLIVFVPAELQLLLKVELPLKVIV